VVGSGLGVFTIVLVVLCFVGARSLHVAVVASGFALGWRLAEGSGAGLGTSVGVAVTVALGAWAAATFVFHATPFFVGAIAGAVVRARMFGLLAHGERTLVLAMLFVLAVAFIAELVTQRFHSVLLAAACALGGAGLALAGLARTSPETLGLLRFPSTAREAVISGVAWLALMAAGWVVQHRPAR
jgi:hypothetical protein